MEGEKDNIVSESSSILSTAATDGPSAPSGTAITAATAAVGTGFDGSFGDDDKDRCSKMDCTGSRGRDLRWGVRRWSGEHDDIGVRVYVRVCFVGIFSLVLQWLILCRSGVGATRIFNGFIA